jgi:hypothetical protein
VNYSARLVTDDDSLAGKALHRIAARARRAVFRLTDSNLILSLIFEHRRFDAKPGATLSPTIAIQGSASVPGVHARSSGSPKDYVEPTYANA